MIKTRTNPFEKLDFSDVFETSIFWSKKYSFLSIILKGNLFLLGLEKSTHGKQFDFFDKNHGLHPLKICDFLHIFLKSSPLCSKSILFYPEYEKNNLFCLGLPKKPTWWKAQFFDKKQGLTPLKITIFWTFLKLHFSELKFIFSIQNIKKRSFLPWFA